MDGRLLNKSDRYSAIHAVWISCSVTTRHRGSSARVAVTGWCCSLLLSLLGALSLATDFNYWHVIQALGSEWSPALSQPTATSLLCRCCIINSGSLIWRMTLDTGVTAGYNTRYCKRALSALIIQDCRCRPDLQH